MFPRCTRLAGVVLLASVMPLSAQTSAYWPQFRGPDRSNVAKDTGLLKEWPKDGPPLLWKVTNLGSGMAPVSIAEGRIYTVAFREGMEYVVALDRGTGKEVWAAVLGPGRQEAGMQFHFQRQPVIDNDQLYVFSANAEILCLEADGGRILWKKDYRKDFGARTSSFGQNDHPLVDGDRLICTPGGKDATLVALNKFTGQVIWKAAVPEGDTASHSPVVIVEIGGIRQYVELLSRGLVGISAKDGTFLWRYNRVANATLNVPAPIVRGSHIFVCSAYGTGSALLKLSSADNGINVQEVYFTKSFQNLNGGVVLVGDHIYGGHRHGIAGGPLGCLEMKTGNLVWRQQGQQGDCTNVFAAEGNLYCRHTSGIITLVEATPEGYKEKGRFMQPDRSRSPPWTYLVLAGRRLYVRDQNLLLCYDLRANRPAPARPPQKSESNEGSRLPDAIFVPSPSDVVERMLELAAVKKADLVVDLGCGDGRIPVAAARKYGCKAIGYDIDHECVERAQDMVKKHKVDDLVRIEHQDIFKVDLSKVDVVCLYLLPHLNAKLLPQIQKMKPGARIVSHAFAMPGVQPDQVVTMKSNEDGIERNLYLWTMPLKKR